MEVGQFSIACRFKNCDDGFVWIFVETENNSYIHSKLYIFT